MTAFPLPVHHTLSGANAPAGSSGTPVRLAVHEAGGVGMILYNNTDSDNLFSVQYLTPA